MRHYLIPVLRMLVVYEKVGGCQQCKRSHNHSHDDEDPAEALHGGAWAVVQALLRQRRPENIAEILRITLSYS